MKNKKILLLTLCSLVCTLTGCSTLSNPIDNNGGSTNDEIGDVNHQGNNSIEPIYASTNFEFEADGSLTNPYGIVQAFNEIRPGQTLYLLDGVYTSGSTIMLSDIDNKYPAKSEAERKTIKPLNPGKVSFNFSQMPWVSTNRGITINADYITFEGFEVYGAGDNGIYIGGNHNIIENCVTHDNGDTGLQLGRRSSNDNTIDSWPSYNLIKNCTSYDNHDPKGEDSDGFACKLTTGVGNVFEGCIAYNNVDDGWDLYAKTDTGPIGPVTMIDCIAFNNGVTTKGVGTNNSDGNGFKLGGTAIEVQHIVKNCIAFNNLATGFTDNSNPGTLWLENCTAFNNGVRDKDANNFDLCRETASSINYMKGLLSYSEKGIDFRTGEMSTFNSKDEYRGTAVESVFYYGKTFFTFDEVEACCYDDTALRGTRVEVGESPFASTEIPDMNSNIHDLLRDDDGTINLGNFLKVNPQFATSIFGHDANLGANLHGGK